MYPAMKIDYPAAHSFGSCWFAELRHLIAA